MVKYCNNGKNCERFANNDCRFQHTCRFSDQECSFFRRNACTYIHGETTTTLATTVETVEMVTHCELSQEDMQNIIEYYAALDEQEYYDYCEFNGIVDDENQWDIDAFLEDQYECNISTAFENITLNQVEC